MKIQEQFVAGTGREVPWAREAKAAFKTLDRLWRGQPFLLQGSVNTIAPKTPGAKVAYTWTRKVRAKTVTVALSKAQAEAFRRAITLNRRVETSLAHLRAASQTALLSSLPGAPKRHPARLETGAGPNVPNGLK